MGGSKKWASSFQVILGFLVVSLQFEPADARVLVEHRGLYRGYRDTGYLLFYFQGYRILSILLPGIWDTWFNIFVTSRDIENLGN